MVIFFVATFSGTRNSLVVNRSVPLGLFATTLEAAALAAVEATDAVDLRELACCSTLPVSSLRSRCNITAMSARETKSPGLNEPSGLPLITPMSYISPTALSKYAPSGTSGKTSEPRTLAAATVPTTPRSVPAANAAISR